MNNNIKINEQDIFKYVFFPQSLSEEKKEYLRENKKYENQISYYKTVKNAINSETSFELKKKIAAKIPAYTLANVFTLYRVKYSEEKEKSGKAIFAAKTKEESPKLKTYTFTDDEKKYLVRIISYEKSTRVYFFSTDNDLVENITIKIFPGEEEFFMKNNSTPLVIDKRIDAESIELRID